MIAATSPQAPAERAPVDPAARHAVKRLTHALSMLSPVTYGEPTISGLGTDLTIGGDRWSIPLGCRVAYVSRMPRAVLVLDAERVLHVLEDRDGEGVVELFGIPDPLIANLSGRYFPGPD